MDDLEPMIGVRVGVVGDFAGELGVFDGTGIGLDVAFGDKELLGGMRPY